MKFKDLVEDKKYRARSPQNGIIVSYRKKDGLLAYFDENRLSVLTMSDVSKMDFTEVKEYVTFEKALEHMKDGGKAQKDEFTFKFTSSQLYCNSPMDRDFSLASLVIDMLEPKWELL